MMAFKSILLIILSAGFVFAQDPTAQFKIDKIQVNNVAGNPYFDDWAAEIISPGDTFSLKTPVKKDLPDTIMMKAIITFAGSSLPDLDIPLCEAFGDVTYGQDVLSNGVPKGIFPTACPVKVGSNFEINKYKFPNSKIPPGVPDGPVVADVTLYEPGKEPYVSLHLEGNLIHKPPGFGR